jgi:diphthamide synthase (EF-2-diphthine--ammonia ligase)
MGGGQGPALCYGCNPRFRPSVWTRPHRRGRHLQVALGHGYDASGSGARQPKSVETTWACVAAADPDVLVVSCCGFDLQRNAADARRVLSSHPVASRLRAVATGSVFAVDGNQYLARPGPSLLPGAAAVAAAVWHADPARRTALMATGLVPAEGVMWGHIDVPAPVRGAPDVEEGAPGCGAPRPSWACLHASAVARGDRFYTDPGSGLLVMTELAHTARGRCCGSGCRHCPFAHAAVPEAERAARIAAPAWLTAPPPPPPTGRSQGAPSPPGAVLLFWSTGKDSLLALRALRRCAAGAPASAAEAALGVPRGAPLALLTTFDAASRCVAHQDTTLDDALRQAAALRLPLLGVPLHRGGPSYDDSVRAALRVARASFPGGLAALAFGDLHLEHVRSWREAAGLHDAARDERLLFPLWRRDYADLAAELDASGVPCHVSAVADEGDAAGAVAVGDAYDAALRERARAAGVDEFGENGEFHTLAAVWDAPDAAAA